MIGGGGGGASTCTFTIALAKSPRASEQRDRTSIELAVTPAVWSVATLPLGESVPLVACQSPIVRGTLSGEPQLHVICDDPPSVTEPGSAEHDMVGGCFGYSLTAKPTKHIADLLFLSVGSVTVTLTSYLPGASRVVSKVADDAFDCTFPLVEAHE